VNAPPLFPADRPRIRLSRHGPLTLFFVLKGRTGSRAGLSHLRRQDHIERLPRHRAPQARVVSSFLLALRQTDKRKYCSFYL
jgi:hypothetical protein